MKEQEYIRCCQSIEEGEEIMLENMDSRRTGRLLFCSTEGFEVTVNGHREAWAPERCQEVASSSESPHENI